jgi:hypothetical protein
MPAVSPTPVADLVRVMSDYGVPIDKSTRETLALIETVKVSRAENAITALGARVRAGKVSKADIVSEIIAAAQYESGRDKIPDAVQEVAQAAELTLRVFVDEHEDEAIIAFRALWDQSARAVERAASFFAPGADPRDILNAGPEAAAAWQDLSWSQPNLTLLKRLRVEIGYISGSLTEGDITHFLDVDSVTDDDDLNRARRHGQNWHAIASEGLRFRLNTASEQADLVRKAASGQFEKDAAVAETRRAARSFR